MKSKNLLKNICIVSGFISILLFIFDFIMLSKLQPKMLSFQILSTTEEIILTSIGFTLIFFLLFYVETVYRITVWLKTEQNINLKTLIILTLGTISAISIFGDIALLSDIAKQYKYGLEQPEWSLLYPLLISQLTSILILTFVHILGLKDKGKNVVKKDSSTFLITQYIGFLCGFLGLGFTSLGFIFPYAWSIEIHTLSTLAILFAPYLISGGYWFLTKMQERDKNLYDEKQIQDMGKSALISLPLSVLFMITLFSVDYWVLNMDTNYIWLPIYLFFNLFTFSLGTLYFNMKE